MVSGGVRSCLEEPRNYLDALDNRYGGDDRGLLYLGQKGRKK